MSDESGNMGDKSGYPKGLYAPSMLGWHYSEGPFTTS